MMKHQIHGAESSAAELPVDVPLHLCIWGFFFFYGGDIVTIVNELLSQALRESEQLTFIK